jgi:hypothetical protein
MPKFLTTAGLNNAIEQLIKSAKNNITLVTPYVKVHKRLKELLIQKKNDGVDIIIVCRKCEIRDNINEFCSLVIDRENLHAKCYKSDDYAIITSMNLYEYSQINNDEMGILVDKKDDPAIFQEIEKEILSFIPIESSSTLPDNYNLIIGKNYNFLDLETIFDFDYKKPSRIKTSIKYNNVIILFSFIKGKNCDKMVDDILYYTGQNPQELIFGNKMLYDCYSNSSKIIHLFRDYDYYGIVNTHEQPYQENGKWIFPLKISFNHGQQSYISSQANLQSSIPIQSSSSLQDNDSYKDLIIGKKYNFSDLETIFNFDYKKQSGIKKSLKYDNVVILFSFTNGKYCDKIIDDIIYYTGQNTGQNTQQLIYGNKILYDCYSNSSKIIHFFLDYTYLGMVNTYKQPYQENGKWIFPLKISCNLGQQSYISSQDNQQGSNPIQSASKLQDNDNYNDLPLIRKILQRLLH